MIPSGAPVLQMNFDSTATIYKSQYEWGDNSSHKTYFLHPAKDSAIVPNGLQIIIDTSYSFHAKGFTLRETVYPDIDDIAYPEKSRPEIADILHRYYGAEWRDKPNFYECHPVLFYNSSSKDMYIFADENFRFIQEALDADGKWKPIEYWEPTPTCIPTGSYVAVRPKHYTASAVLKYHGNFKTKIRVRFETQAGVYFSNAITGYINKSQFDKFVLERNPWVQEAMKIPGQKYWPERMHQRMNFLVLDRKDWQRKSK